MRLSRADLSTASTALPTTPSIAQTLTQRGSTRPRSSYPAISARSSADSAGRYTALGRDLAAWVEWYHEHRPHQGLGGQTPADVRDGRVPASDGVNIPTRVRDGPSPVSGLELRIDFVRGKRHLPIVKLKRAA